MKLSMLNIGVPNARNVTLAVFALLLFVLPIPGTIALRHSLFAIMLVLLGVHCWPRFRQSIRSVGPALPILLALSAWMTFHAFFISPETTWAWREIKSQWWPAVLAFLCGALLVSSDDGGRRVMSVSILSLLAQSLFALLVSIPDLMEHGVFPQAGTRWVAGKLEASYANNLLLAFLAVDLIFRVFYRRQISRLPTALLVAGVALVIVSNVAFIARNGIIGSVMLLLSLSLVVLWRERKRFEMRQVTSALLICIALVGVISWMSYRFDARWQKFSGTVVMAWDIDANKAWLDRGRHTYPVLPNGHEVDPSAYVRVAWIRAGLRMVAENPLGVGYGRNAFGHALRQTEDTRLGHAHSGIIDLTLGVGIPGLLLWLAFVGVSLSAGWRRYRDQNDPRGLILFFVTAGFFGRMLLDSINRDHMLVMFFLLLGTLLPVIANNSSKRDVDE